MNAGCTWCFLEPGIRITCGRNIASLLKPPLPEADRQKLTELFGHLLGVGLEVPG